MFEYTSTLVEPSSDVLDRLTELIDLSWNVPEKPDSSTTEEDRLRAEARKIPKVKIEGDTITELNKIAYAYTKCEDPAETLAEIPPLEQLLV